MIFTHKERNDSWGNNITPYNNGYKLITIQIFSQTIIL